MGSSTIKVLNSTLTDGGWDRRSYSRRSMVVCESSSVQESTHRRVSALVVSQPAVNRNLLLTHCLLLGLPDCPRS